MTYLIFFGYVVPLLIVAVLSWKKIRRNWEDFQRKELIVTRGECLLLVVVAIVPLVNLAFSVWSLRDKIEDWFQKPCGLIHRRKE